MTYATPADDDPTEATLPVTTGDTPRFSLLICGPGAEIYELEGHAALRVQTPYRDEVISWGLFDFNEPNFVYRFVRGKTDYWCGRTSTSLFINEYINQGRWVVEHDLQLTDEQARRLFEAVEDNLRMENRKYRYKYFSDNCATRPLSLIEQAVGYDLHESADLVSPEGNTYREMLENYHDNYPWYQFGIDIALGCGIDRPITQRQKAFAPIYLDQMMNRIYYISSDGRHHPLSVSRRILNVGTIDPTIDSPTPLPLRPTFIAWVIFIVAIGLTLRDMGRRHVTRWFDAVLYSIFGLIGLVVAFLLFFSDHEGTTPNLLIFWLNPICFIVPITIYTKYRRILGYYQIVNLALIVIVIISNISNYRALNAAFYPLILADIARAVTTLSIFKFKKPSNNK